MVLSGIFLMISNFIGINSLTTIIKLQYASLLNAIFPLICIISSLFVLYPLMPSKWKENIILPIIWNISIFAILVCCNFYIVLISNFSGINLIIFMINIIVITSLMRWYNALLFLFVGVIFTLLIFHHQHDLSLKDLFLLEFKIVYILLCISAIVILFLRPKQEYFAQTEAKVNLLSTEVIELTHQMSSRDQKILNLSQKVSHFSTKVKDQAKEIERLGITAQKILNNVNHELRLPVGNVLNFAEMLHEGLGTYSQEQLKDLSDEVYKNTTRLSSMILNMLDLATLNAKKITLQKKIINFSDMVEDRVKQCRAIYLEDKPIDFRLTITPEILISIDPNYMKQVVDNLVINAINFSKNGLIEVIVKKNADYVNLIIIDEGIGIPAHDIYDIFEPFKMGSNTESQAQGRGVGLALCKSAIEAHNGTIAAESGNKKTKFTVTLPL